MKKYAFCGWKKKGILLVLLVLAVSVFPMMPVKAAKMESATEILTGSIDAVNLEEMFSEVKDKLKEAFEKIDKETALKMFDFVKEKLADGSLETESGLEEAIAEGETLFGVTVDKEAAKQVVETMEKLEAMGFSGEEVVEKAKRLYEEYGAEFVDHANEAITEVVESAVEDAVNSFFENLWEGAQDFFRNLF